MFSQPGMNYLLSEVLENLLFTLLLIYLPSFMVAAKRGYDVRRLQPQPGLALQRVNIFYDQR